MKRPIVTAMCLFGGLWLGAGVATTAPQEAEIVANVPFDFVAGTTPMPAGKYVVKSNTENPDVVLIESTDGRHAAFAITIPVTNRATDQSTLTFEKRDNQYVLSRLMTDDGEGREIAAAAATHARPSGDAAATSR